MYISGPGGGVIGGPRASSTLGAGVDHLRMIVGHHVWATLRLIDLCLELSQEQLALSISGTYGSIHATLAHLVQGDIAFRRWIEDQEVVPTAGARGNPTRRHGATGVSMA
jgi:uncharacterized damage-inducible protein DinB